MYEVVLSPEATDFYTSADRPLAARLARCFTRLERDPLGGNNVKRLAGDLAGYLRYRVGDWRVVYRVDRPTNRIHVVAIAHRREVYE